MTSKLRIAVIGAGGRGTNLALNFHNSTDWEIAAICDVDRDRAQRLAETVGGARAVTALSELLDAEDLDAVAIATPASTQHGITRAALNAGKHVMVETPLADTGRRGRDMVRAAAERGLVLMADHIDCYTPAIQEIRELIEEGALGDILFVDSVRISRRLVQSHMDVFWDLAPHELAIIDFILPGGLRPLSVTAHGADPLRAGNAGIGYLVLPLSNSAIAHVHVNWLSPTPIRQMIVGGTKHTLVWDGLNPRQAMSLYGRDVDLDLQALDRADRTWTNAESPILPDREALGAMAREFADSIRQMRLPLTDGEAGLRILSVLEAANRSLAMSGTATVIDEHRVAAGEPS